MKLRYFRARNVLSFGDEEVELEFSPFSIIAGPNDSGKTNLFRALSLIEQAFDYGKPPIEEILFQGDNDKALHLEVGVELDDTELELLTTLIICSEMARVQAPEDITAGIKENKHWKSILLNYGNLILSKSLKCLSFIISKDESRLSEPKMVVQLSDETGRIYIHRDSCLSETSQETGGFQRVSLARQIMEDFTSRFGNPSEIDVDSLIQDIKKLSEESPMLIPLFKGKLDGSPPKRVEFRGGDFSNYLNSLGADPILTKLSQLCERRGIDLERLYVWRVLEQFYKTSFVRLQELRFFPSNLAYADAGQDSKSVTILGSDLAKKLFLLMSSGTRKNREKYNRIKKEFEKLTGAEFDIAVRGKEIEVSEEKLGVIVSSQYLGYGGSGFTPLGVQRETEKKKVNETFIHIIKGNYPVPIDQAASGLYEILFLLTAVIGESERTLLLDEPELHLHPTMQKRILNLLSEFGTKDRNQIVLITHSPYLVSAEGKKSTWRFTASPKGTKVHNIGKALSELQRQEKGKFDLKLSTPDVRSILFSRGVILVEGLSDKITVEQIDRFLSAKEKGANLDENEWSVLDIDGKPNLPLFIKLFCMLDIPSLAVLDDDALMCKDHTIELISREIKTSVIFFALQRTGQLEGSQSNADLLSEAPNSQCYTKAHFEDLKTLSSSKGIFVFSSDLEGVMQLPKTSNKRKPMQALERILELISQDKIPSEFYSMCDFLRKKIKETGKSQPL
jgi:energy-coupling factor transporter ATP-binding protein EcfA2